MVDFNSQFGYNVKNYQQLKAGFGSTVRGGSFANANIRSMDSSVFDFNSKIGTQNIFDTSASKKYSFGGKEYDNAFDMLNSVGKEQKSGKSSFREAVVEIFNKIGDAVEGLMSKIGKLFGKKGSEKTENNVDKTLDNLKNAQDKEALNQALDGAKNEKSENVKKEQAANKAEKQAETQEAKAEKKSEQADQQVDTNNQQLEQDKNTKTQADQSVTDAETRVNNATQGVAQAEKNLAAAKSAATKDNPNTEAIQRAEQELKTAKDEEAAAKQELEKAKQGQTEAENAVDASTEQVQTSETEADQAKKDVTAAGQEVQTSQQEVKSAKQDGTKIDSGIQEGEQRLQQMESTEGGAQTAAPEGQSQNIQSNDGHYYVNGYQVDEDMYNAAQSMDQNVVDAGFSPGSTCDVYMDGVDEPKTFTVSEGKYMVDGQEVDSQTFLNEYNNAKAHEESGMDGGISLINDDYSKYNSSGSPRRASANSGTSSGARPSSSNANTASRPPADESGVGQVDQEFAEKNRRREEAELAAYFGSRGV